MLINLSNYSSSMWSEKQIKAANSQFGTIIDLPFPQINPEGANYEVDRLASEFAEKILEINFNHKMKRAETDDGVFSSNSLTVHIMGELTFCYAMIQKLQIAKIPCVASTTARNSEIDENGNKISVFEFVRFRKYF